MQPARTVVEPEDDGMDARVEAFVKEQLGIQRRNLLGACRMCIKSLVDKSVFEVISDDCPHMANLCITLEHIFIHRIQKQWTLFASNEVPQFWHVISKLAPPISIGSVQDMEEIQTDLGRGRAWLRLALVQKRLSSFMNSLLTKMDVLRELYHPGAFLISEEVIELAGIMKCLDVIDLNLCLRGHDFDFGERNVIDYSQYLRFIQSRDSCADDDVEELKLKNPRPKHPPTLAVEAEGGGGGEGERKGREDTIGHVREMLKTEREQKNYFEELVGVRDSQLARAQAGLSSLTEERDRLQNEMERIVLELQQQIEKQQVELGELRRRLQGSSSESADDVENLLPRQGTSSTKKRTSSFSVFSSFLGSD